MWLVAVARGGRRCFDQARAAPRCRPNSRDARPTRAQYGAGPQSREAWPRTRIDRGRARARELAIQGFEATIKGTRSQLDFSENDSGEVAAATRDAARADRYLTLGANRLRAAGRAFGIQIGKLNEH